LGRDHPCAVGVPPHVPEAGLLWDEADVVVAVGSDFDGMMTQNWRMPAPQHLVAVNVDAVDASKSYQPEVLITADAAKATRALAERLGERGGIEALDRRLTALREEVRDDLVADCPEAVAFLEAFDAAVPSKCTVVADMCIPGYWLAAFHPLSGPRRLAYPVGWGTLGFAFPAAIGAALGSTDPVVSVSGDGGFLFACGELATVAQENVPLTVLIVDDGGYGMLRYDQRHSGDEPFGVDLLTPDFVALARSFGLEAESVTGLGKDFGDALDDHVRRGSPSVLVARASLDPPPTTSPRWYRAR
jgi:thiamine pyrophosphate-dependent acetolactate synthase large subunit-like protein